MVKQEESVLIRPTADDLPDLLGLAEIAQTNEQIEAVEAHMLTLPQLQEDVRHNFSEGVYARELHIPKGAFVIGHKHKTRHLNMLIKGRLTVIVNGQAREVSAPFIIDSLPGSRKMGFAHEDSVWVNIHATNETDLTKLEDALIEKSPSFIRHQIESEANKMLDSVKQEPIKI